ncbi:ABC transporter permease [Leucobacter chromiireducens]|uniref:ABC transporter permease n=1 Tax=Leucobacter chromiireducens TaxID=283877 RepID=UPI001F156F63|nr:ABC transporter permease [Leucobacter chromiireducens]
MTVVTQHRSPQPDREEAEPASAPGLIARALREPRMVVGVVLAGLVVGIAVIGPLFAPHSPTEFVGPPFAQPGQDALLGTDNLGRDVVTRFLFGGRLLLLLAVLATLGGVGIGALVGVVAAYRRGWVDELLMRLGDVALAFPQLVLALLFLAVFGPQPALLVVLVAVGHLPRVARVVRGAAMSVVKRDFVRAAEVVGTPRWRIVVTEVLPNVSSTLAVEFGLRLTYSIGILAGLSFLGLGMQPPAADWGLMINENRIALTVAPWAVVLPVLAIAVLTVGTNLIADGLARAAMATEVAQ